MRVLPTLIAGLLAIATTAEANESTTVVNHWFIWESVSRLDDSKSVTLRVGADESIWISPYDRVRPELLIRCFEKVPAIFVNYDHFLGSDTISVTYRIDDHPPRTDIWSITTDRNGAGLAGARGAYPMIRQLLDARELVVRLVPFSENAATVSFPVDGFAKRSVRSPRRAIGRSIDTSSLFAFRDLPLDFLERRDFLRHRHQPQSQRLLEQARRRRRKAVPNGWRGP